MLEDKPRQIAYAAIFAAALAITGLLTRFLPPAVVPFSLQPLMVFLIGGLLNKRTAVLSLMAYLLLGFIGIPIFASPPYGGLIYLFRPSCGFLLGFVLAVWIMAYFLEQVNKNRWTYLVAGLLGFVAYNLIGLPYLYLILKFYLGQVVDIWYIFKIGLLPFIIFDIVKAGLAAVICDEIRKRV